MKHTMKKLNFLFIALIIGLGFTSCMKSNDIEPYDGQKYFDLEAPILKAYVDTAQGMESAMLDETGIWYVIEEAGLQDPEDPDYYEYNLNSNGDLEMPEVTVNYIGKLVPSGFVFNDFEDQTFSLASLLVGWRIAFLPENMKDRNGDIIVDQNGDPRKIGITELGLQKGSKIRIVMPSPYGYQSQSREGIPANSPLDFYIEVLEVNPPSSPY